MAKANPFRFSTKFQDSETDLLYYGFRYYNPSLQPTPVRSGAGVPGWPVEAAGSFAVRLGAAFFSDQPEDRAKKDRQAKQTQSQDGG